MAKKEDLKAEAKKARELARANNSIEEAITEAPEEAAAKKKEKVEERALYITLPVDLYDYIKVLSGASNQTVKSFIIQIISEHKEEHGKLYEQLKELLGNL